MGFKKSTGRGRLDKYYHLAKEKGYRARAAFKLIQLNKKYHVLEKSHALLDLCAAPGSWCQVAAEVMPPNSLIVGVDLAPIKAIPRCITFQSDITTDKCRATIRQHFKTLKADTVLHDGAPNVGTAWVQDAFSQAELVLQSLRLATEFLAPGGTFITKIFRSKDYNSLLWVFNQLFGKVEATKPPSSRNVSAEIFVVCREYKAPKRIDPRFLDPKSVFAELADPTPNNEAKVFNPDKKKRKREGYEEGDWTQYKEAPVTEFIQTTDPIAMLGSLNRLSFDPKPNGDLALATLERLPETTPEVRNCCADLKVLGRSDFKLLLRWRLKVRDKFGMSAKKKQSTQDHPAAGEEVAEVESMDDEMRIQEEMHRLKEQADSKKRKERRKDNERKQKEMVRLQLNMTTPTDIGMDQAGPQGEDSLFAFKNVEKLGTSSKFARGKMNTITPKPDEEEEQGARNEGVDEEQDEDDEEEDNLEGQLDAMYEEFQERKMEADAKYKAKKARKEGNDEEFEGFSDREVSSDDEIVEDEDDSDDDSSDADEMEDDESGHLQRATSNGQQKGELSKRAAMFFDQDVFKNIDGLEDMNHSDSGIDMEEDDSEEQQPEAKQHSSKNAPANSDKATSKTKLTDRSKPPTIVPADATSDTSDHGFEIVKQTNTPNTANDPAEPVTKSGRPDVDIITAEAMTLAHALATGRTTRAALQDDSFNKYSLRDVAGLPAWFLDDEDAHSKPQKPITAAAAAAIKEKQRALNARPIKKVREAQARKKFRAAQRLEKLKKKSALLVEDSEMSERDKATEIARIMAKAGAKKKSPRQSVKLVVAKHGNKGIQGRPRGTKGKYKMVDSRMKKEKRAEKRIAKQQKGKKK